MRIGSSDKLKGQATATAKRTAAPPRSTGGGTPNVHASVTLADVSTRRYHHSPAQIMKSRMA